MSRLFVASAAVRQRFCLYAHSAMAAPSSWATLPKLKASLPFGPNRFGPIWSVPMHGATASMPWLMNSCVAGAANSTSQVTMPITAPLPIRLAAQAFDFAGFEFCVSQVMILSGRPLTPPLALIFAISSFAAASAGPSKGAMLPFRSVGKPITIGLPAALAVLEASAATATSAARASRGETCLALVMGDACLALLPMCVIPPSWSSRLQVRAELVSPGRLLRLDEPVHGGVQRNGNAQPSGLTDERPGDQVDLRPPACFDVLQHRRIVGAAAARREHVHLPGVVVQLDARRGGHRLALLDQRAHEVAEGLGRLLGGEVPVVGQAGEGGDGVDGGIEDQLRPLGGPQVGQRLRLEARRPDQRRDLRDALEGRLFVRAEPGLGVEDVLDLGVRVLAAAHEG